MPLQTEMAGDFQERRREWQERGRCRQCGGDIITIAGVRRCDECGLAFDQELTRDLVEPKPGTRLVPWAELAKARGKQQPGLTEPIVTTTATITPAKATRHSEGATAEPDTMPRPVPWAVKAEAEQKAKAAAGKPPVATPAEELAATPTSDKKRR